MIELLIERRTRDLGGGLQVGRVLPFHRHRMVGPFIFLDHLGPLDLAAGFPAERDVRPHPHIGLSTLTYLFEGRITHRDSLGYTQEIRAEEVNWMTAGRGITHSERLEHLRHHGGRLHALQAWVALPSAAEEIEPSFHHFETPAELPVWEDEGLRGRLLAGRLGGLAAAVPVHSPLFYLHWTLAAGARTSLPAVYPERAIYVVTGAVDLGGEAVAAGQLAVLAPGGEVPVEATADSTVMALGGEPVASAGFSGISCPRPRRGSSRRKPTGRMAA